MRINEDRNQLTGITQNAIVSGGAGALGSEIARRLVREGYRVAVVDNQGERARQVVAELANLGGHATPFEMDVCDVHAWQKLRAELQSEWQHLDVLVNAAGVTVIGDFCQTDVAEQRRVIDVNLNGTLIACHVICPWLLAHPRPSYLVNIASCAAFLNFPWSVAYNASKAGVLALSETLAAEFRESPMHVCAVCPGFFESQLFSFADPHDESLAQSVGHVLSQTQLTAERVAERVWDAMRRKKPYVIVPRRVAWMCRMKRLFPVRTTRQLALAGQKLRAKYRSRT